MGGAARCTIQCSDSHVHSAAPPISTVTHAHSGTDAAWYARGGPIFRRVVIRGRLDRGQSLTHSGFALYLARIPRTLFAGKQGSNNCSLHTPSTSLLHALIELRSSSSWLSGENTASQTQQKVGIYGPLFCSHWLEFHETR